MSETYQGTHKEQEWRIRLVNDRDVENPRDQDNLWTLVMNHRRQKLGDEQLTGAAFEDRLNELSLTPANCLLIPLYAYEHGDIAFSTQQTGQFSDRFDAGQIGVAYLPISKVIEEYGSDADENRATAIKCLGGELETYTHYVNGETFGFTYETRPVDPSREADDDSGWKEQESAWGFYGADPKENGMLDHFDQHVVEAINPPPAAPSTPVRRRAP